MIFKKLLFSFATEPFILNTFNGNHLEIEPTLTIIGIASSLIYQDFNMAKGIIKRYDFRKGFGFIVDEKSGTDLFFHKTEWQGDGPIRQGIAVKFTEKNSDKGPQAEAVIPVDGSTKKSSKNNKPAAKSVSLEDRVTSLEGALGTYKVLSFLALAGVIALVVEKFVR